MTLEKHHYAILLIMSMHIAGSIGLQLDITRNLFEQLVPFNLIVSALLLLVFHEDWNKSFIYFIIIAFFTGYFVEVAGVQTGIIFGEYQYDTALGFKFLDVPLLIGVNWFILVYATGITSNFLHKNLLLKSVLGASIMTALDYFIEPVAIEYHFWHWESEIIPLQNYFAWFIIAFVLHIFFNLLLFSKKNKVATPILIAQILFFISFV